MARWARMAVTVAVPPTTLAARLLASAASTVGNVPWSAKRRTRRTADSPARVARSALLVRRPFLPGQDLFQPLHARLVW